MEAPVIAAISAAIGAISGAVVVAVFNYRAHRESLDQRSREHVVAKAYEAATAEWKAGLESFTKLYPDGGFVQASYAGYLVYHLTLAQLLIDRQGIERLDEQSIAHALDEAKRSALVVWNTEGLPWERNAREPFRTVGK